MTNKEDKCPLEDCPFNNVGFDTNCDRTFNYDYPYILRCREYAVYNRGLADGIQKGIEIGRSKLPTIDEKLKEYEEVKDTTINTIIEVIETMRTMKGGNDEQ